MSAFTLTRKADVLLVLRAGGTVQRHSNHPCLLRLLDAAGNEVPAWQQAIASAARDLSIVPTEDNA